MSEIVQITDYDAVVLPSFLEQFKKSPNIKGVVSSLNSQGNDLEAALFEVRDLFWVDTATGVQLDTIGVIWDVARGGRTDTVYRQAIQEKISLINSGTPKEIMELLRANYGATFIEYDQGPSKATFYLNTDATINSDELDEVSPAGVQGYLVNPIVDAVGNFLVDAVDNQIVSVSNVSP